LGSAVLRSSFPMRPFPPLFLLTFSALLPSACATASDSSPVVTGAGGTEAGSAGQAGSLGTAGTTSNGGSVGSGGAGGSSNAFGGTGALAGSAQSGAGGSSAGSAGLGGSAHSGAGGASAGSAGIAGSAAGGSAGHAGSVGAGGTGGIAGGSGGAGGCAAPSGTTCGAASSYCATIDYAVGDKVMAMCAVNTGGCISGRNWLFTCSAVGCGTHAPGTAAGEGFWTITQCN